MSRKHWIIVIAAGVFVAWRIWEANKAGLAVGAAFAHPFSLADELIRYNQGKDQGKYTIVAGGLHPTAYTGAAFAPAAYVPGTV